MTAASLREARYQDLPEVANLTARAFWQDDICGDRIHPHREKYPEDVDLYWLRRARLHFFDARWRFVLATKQDDSGREVIAGCAQWSRMGEGGKGMDYHWSDPRSSLKGIMSPAMRVHALIWPNRAADPVEEDVIERSITFVEDSWTGPRADYWSLEVMAVHPDYQSQGFGRMLVDWGLRRAREEGIHASVISAKGKDMFYKKCGFHLEDGYVGKGDGNPLAGWEGGRMLWMVPGVKP